MGLRVFSRSASVSGAVAAVWLGSTGCAEAEGDRFPLQEDPRVEAPSGASAVELVDAPCAGGTCVLRVDPAAPTNGDGSSWESPIRDLQTAIDAQAASGGGDVWVRGGGPFEALSGDPRATLVQLRPRVRVFGGFEGTELGVQERDGEARTLILGSPATDDDVAEPLITGASDATLDGFSVFGHNGTSLSIREATNFHVANLTIEESAVYAGGQVDVADSKGRFEQLRIRASTSVHGVPGLLVAQSDVAVSRAEFSRLRTLDGAASGVAAQGARLVLDRVWFAENDSDVLGKASGLAVTDSDVVLLESVWLDNRGDRGTVSATASRLLAVSSHWENNRAIAPAASFLKGSSAWFLNTSFVTNRASAYGTVFARDSTLEIVNASFADNDVDFPTAGTYAEDVGLAGTGRITLYNSFSNRGASSVFEPYAGAGNCLVEDTKPSSSTSAGSTQILLRAEYGCTDRGDSAAALAATDRAEAFAETLGATTPLAGAWWRGSSSVLGVISDTGAIDPGRHYAR